MFITIIKFVRLYAFKMNDYYTSRKEAQDDKDINQTV